LAFRTVFIEHRVDQDKIGGNLADFAALGLVAAVRRVDQEAEDQRRDRAHETGSQPHEVPRMIVEMMVRQPPAQQCTNDRAEEHDPASRERDPDGLHEIDLSWDRRVRADGRILALLRNGHGLLFAGVPARMLAFA
jgi:hypothetical protein